MLLTVLALHGNADSLWTDIDQFKNESGVTDWNPVAWITSTDSTADDTKGLNAMASNARLLKADIEQLSAILHSDEPEKTIPLPLPDGTTVEYRLTEVPVLAEALRLKYPSIKTLQGHEVGNPDNSGHFDITPQGFHAMFLHQGETLFIDPHERGNNQLYISYRKQDAAPLAPTQNEQVVPADNATEAGEENGSARRFSSDNTLRTYRLAMGATGEYTHFHGGTREGALAAIVTAVNRVNSVFERDLAIRLELVSDNDALIYTDPVSDPFANNDTDLDNITAELARAIGSDAFDIGHLLTTNGGGVARVGVVCASTQKGGGLTGSALPTGDSFYIDLLAHEIGHQFGASHTFNGGTGACEGSTRAPGSAYEPGSGSTIMSYAGICGKENLQFNSDAYFHAHSIEQINSFVTRAGGAQCGTRTPLPNQAPVADAGRSFTIPARTPFQLTGAALDTDGDALTYVWEQYDLGPASSSRETMVDDGERPIFRSRPPSSLPERILPQLADVLRGKTTVGEAYPTTTRELNFRLTVRDARGGTSHDDMTVFVNADAGPFALREPALGSRWNGNTSAQVSWDVAATDAAPIHCEAVQIDLSTDGGYHFTRQLAASTPNDGEHWVIVPDLNSDRARVRVSCRSNVFFAVSDGDFEIVQGSGEFTNTAPVAGDDEAQITFGSAESTIDVLANDSDSDAGDVLAIVAINYTGAGQVQIDEGKLLYTPATDFSGTERFGYTIADQAGATAIATVTVTVTPEDGGKINGGNASSSSSGGGGGALSLPVQLLLALLIMAGRRGLTIFTVAKAPVVAAIALAVAASGCGTAAPDAAVAPAPAPAPTAQLPLAWVETANVKEDIARAMAAGDYRLLALSGRRTTLPGLDENEMETGQAACGVRYLQGTGDAVESDAGIALRNKVYHYASQYNRAMLVICMEVGG